MIHQTNGMFWDRQMEQIARLEAEAGMQEAIGWLDTELDSVLKFTIFTLAASSHPTAAATKLLSPTPACTCPFGASVVVFHLDNLKLRGIRGAQGVIDAPKRAPRT